MRSTGICHFLTVFLLYHKSRLPCKPKMLIWYYQQVFYFFRFFNNKIIYVSFGLVFMSLMCLIISFSSFIYFQSVVYKYFYYFSMKYVSKEQTVSRVIKEVIWPSTLVKFHFCMRVEPQTTSSQPTGSPI